MEKTITNRVLNSKLISLDLEDFNADGRRVMFDLKDHLYQGMILREKEFRDSVSNHDWGRYENAFVNIYCSADAIVPSWAYMLVAVNLQPYARLVVFGTTEDLEKAIFDEQIKSLDFSQYDDAKIVIKGCSNSPVGEYGLVKITAKLRENASSIMFGEPCSTVPIYKSKKL